MQQSTRQGLDVPEVSRLFEDKRDYMMDQNESYNRVKYRRSPLQEVIFEARFVHDRFDNAVPGQIYEKIRHQFPAKKDLQNLIITLGAVDAASQGSPGLRVPCIQAWNQQGTQCLQVGPGIIVANDRTYEGWEGFLPAIETILDAYLAIAQPEQIERVGLRFINRIVIPGEIVSVADSFQLGLVVPPALGTPHAFDITFDSRAGGEFEICTKVRFATDAPRNGENGVAFILDIDAFVSRVVPIQREEIIRVAYAAHARVGTIFEGILRPATRKLFGPEQI